MDGSVPGNLDTIASNAEHPVVLAYIASRHDTVVDVRHSASEFRDAAIEHGFTFLLWSVDSTHAGINDDKEKYYDAITAVLKESDRAQNIPLNLTQMPNDYSQVGPGF